MNSLMSDAFLIFLSYLFTGISLLLFYIYVLNGNKRLKKAKTFSELSESTIRFIKKNESSREKILDNLKIHEAKLLKSKKFSRIIFFIIIFYFAFRVFSNVLNYFYLGLKIDFPKLTDFIVFLVIDLLCLIVVSRKILLLSIKTKFDELPRLLEKGNNGM